MAKNPAADIATAANDMMSSVIASATSTLQAQPAAAKENLDAMNKAAELAKTRFAELQLAGTEKPFVGVVLLAPPLTALLPRP